MQRMLPCLAAAVFLHALQTTPAFTRDCSYRGQLDRPYCDENHDLVADAPTDPSKWRDPPTLVWAYTPIEDPAVYASLFKPLTLHLEQCLGRQVVYYPVQSSAAQIDAMRAGRLHFAGFSTGATSFAVNRAGAVPFAGKGVGTTLRGYELIAVVDAASPYRRLTDLKGRRVAHVSPFSNSGNLAPRVLFPEEGLVPGKDYVPLMSGAHSASILGVIAGDYDMAAVASDVLSRMIERKAVRAQDLRIIYKSPTFPTSSFAYAHDLAPALAARLRACFFNFRFTPEMRREFQGDEQFVPITYARDWAVVRAVGEGSGALAVPDQRPAARQP